MFPFRYVGNLIKGITDIFVFKFGWGIGGGAEVGVLGAGGVYGYLPLEYATAYPKIRSNLQEAEAVRRFENRKKDAYFGLAYVYVGTCMNALLFRSCEDLKKYISANAWGGVGPAVFIGMELHRLLEYVGVIFFQDWNLMNAPTDRFHYFSYQKLEPLSLKFKIKPNLPLFPSFSESGVPVGNRLVASELLNDKITKGFIVQKEGVFLKQVPEFDSNSIGYLPFESEVGLLEVESKTLYNLPDTAWIKVKANNLEGWVLNTQLVLYDSIGKNKF